MSLSGKVVVVTGASRGIGRGIALELGSAGAKVYVTGRPPAVQDKEIADLKTDTLGQVAEQITARGGQGVAVYVDHADDAAVEALFKRVEEENNGQLDILVNNAYAAVNYLFRNIGKKFYELDPAESFDLVNKVGLRSHYVSSVHASRLFVKRQSGLIVNISSAGGFNVSYGAGKSAVDRLASDMAVELRGTGVSAVSLWPGAVKTEMIVQNVIEAEGESDSPLKKSFSAGESPEYSGRIIAALYNDPDLKHLSGSILTTSALGRKYGIKDLDGSQPKELPEGVTQVLATLNVVRTNPHDFI